MRISLFLILTLVACCFLFINAFADPMDELGACCLGDGMTCFDGISEDSCNALGCTWMGAESSCGEFDEGTGWSGCQEEPATGACCYNSGFNCVETDEETCSETYEGTWMGSGVECGEFDEETGWSGCQGIGACCYNEGYSCVDGVTDDSCAHYSESTWMGAGTSCGEFDEETGWSGCQEEPTTGACCYDDGMSCTNDVEDWYCYEVLGGTYMGDGSSCGEYDEETGWSGCTVQEETGACCLENGMVCTSDVDYSTCEETLGGTYMGNGSSCGEYNEDTGWSGCTETTPTGACCMAEGMNCVNEVTEDSCINYLGGTWMEEGSSCGEFDEENGWSGCIVTIQTGACCMAEGMSCVNEVTEDSCINYLGGTWMDEGSDCGEFDEETGWSGCAEQEDGACCWYSGEYCVVTNQFTCEEGYSGVWLGSGTSCGEYDEETGWSGCEAAVFYGACCMDEGWNCVNGVTEDSCVNYLGGQWRGQDSDCGTYNEESGWGGCYVPTYGACCIDSSMSCVSGITRSVCTAIYGGAWMGEDTDCSDDDENGVADVCEESDTYDYLPGDANMAAETWPAQTIGGDVTYLVNYFRGISDPCMLDGFYASADATGDCIVVGGDVTYLVNYFRGLNDMNYCVDYEPAWPTPSDVPTDAPDGWPNCD